MGIRGVRQTSTETPKSLREIAKELLAVARSLDSTAEDMLLRGIIDISVRNGPGAKSAIREKLEPFAADAKRKASIAKQD
jgi:hypothetical protein